MPPFLPPVDDDDQHRPAAVSTASDDAVGAVPQMDDELEWARAAFLAARTHRQRRKALQRLEQLKARKARG